MGENKKSKKNKPAAETSGEDAAKKSASEKEQENEKDPKTELPAKAPSDRKCMQKPNGRYYCFRLVQGRWVQASGNAYPSLEVCEAFCYGE